MLWKEYAKGGLSLIRSCESGPLPQSVAAAVSVRTATSA